MSRPSWISRRSWYSPRFQWHYWRAKRHEARLIQQPCSEGNCVELIDPNTGDNTGGWGPVECPCQTADTRVLPPDVFADGCVGIHQPDRNPICAGHLKPADECPTPPGGFDA